MPPDKVIDVDDLSDLPPELLRELSVSRASRDELEEQIVALLHNRGPTSIDQILIGLYRKFSVIKTRIFIQNKLYRMAKRELITRMPNRRYAPRPSLRKGGSAPTEPGEN